MFVNSPWYRIKAILERKKVPLSRDLNESLERAFHALNNESIDIRPQGNDGQPGGLVLLRSIPTIVVPDLHARIGYLEALLSTNIFDTELDFRSNQFSLRNPHEIFH